MKYATWFDKAIGCSGNRVQDLPAPPFARPGKIICVGVNYPERNAEYKDGTDAPKYPSLFVRFPGSFVGNNQPIIRPRESAQFDYEGEIVLVIGKPGRRIAESHALAHVFGITLMNEGSVRDWLRHGKFNVTQGKNFDRSGSIGPCIVTREAAGDLNNLDLVTRVNGEERQRGNTGTLMFPFARIINYISTFTTLEPGDLIATGTPPGAGARFDPPKWLVPGDVVEIECPAVGVLRNTVADENANA
jgi:2-keto-4-pentenoate hydratase/2-oxohepta-3-ene-1,7-dioic acid hydratase in catechol pathway